MLLLDEPLSNLDAKLRVEMRAEIRQLQKQLGITALYVTHDQEEALAISDRIAVMRAGRVEQIATPRAIYERAGNAVRRELRRHHQPDRGHRPRPRRAARWRSRSAAAWSACAARRGKAGESVVLSLRPEALRLLGAGEPPPPGWASLAGELGEIEYLGPVTRFARHARRRHAAAPDGARAACSARHARSPTIRRASIVMAAP